MQLGDWLQINGEAIYKTSPWTFRQEPLNSEVWYTCIDRKKLQRINNESVPPPRDEVYTIFLKWPENNKLKLKGLALLLIDGIYKMQLLEREGRRPIEVSVTEMKKFISVFLFGIYQLVYSQSITKYLSIMANKHSHDEINCILLKYKFSEFHIYRFIYHSYY